MPPPEPSTSAVPRSVTPAGVRPSSKLKAICGVAGGLRLVTLSVTSVLVAVLFGPVAVALNLLPEAPGWTLVMVKVVEVAPAITTLLLYHW